jgi:phage terminase large subunit
LITQTRWHEDDLSGRILKSKQAHEWEVLTLPGVLETAEKHEDDPRNIGEALWASRHSLKKLLDFKDASPRLFQAMYQQDPRPFEGGLVYPNWNKCSLKEYNQVRIEEINGLDFGYSTSPAAFIGIKIDEKAKRIYLRLKIYGKFIKLKQLAEQIQDKLESPRQQIIADSADPLLIEHLKTQYKMNVHKAVKGKDSVSFGITLMNNFELVVVDSGGESLIRELKNYRYKEDADGNPLDEPVKEYDHALDAARYVVLKKLGRKGSKFTVF